jgi:CHAT domain
MNDRILIVCCGSSGETYQWIEKKEVDRLLRNAIRLHKFSDCLAEKDEKGTLTFKMRTRFITFSRKFGEYLFSIVFSGEIFDILNSTVGQAIKNMSDVQLIIMLASDFLNVVPWELLCHRGTYLSHIYDIIRHPFTLEPIRRPDVSKGAGKIVFLAADPDHNIYVKGQIEAVRKALKAADILDEKLKCDTEATVSSIASHIFRGGEILHILAHGQEPSAPDDPQSYFVVNGDGRDKQQRLTGAMLQSFCRAGPMRVAVLCACRSDQPFSYSTVSAHQLSKNRYASIAHDVIQTGFPCVIGMSHQISKGAGEIMTRRLYQGILTNTESIPKVVRQGRLELFAYGEMLLPSDWFSVILYLRRHDEGSVGGRLRRQKHVEHALTPSVAKTGSQILADSTETRPKVAEQPIT